MNFKKIVKCEACKCLISKDDAQAVNIYPGLCGNTTTFYYCKQHTRKYDYIQYYGFFTKNFYKTIEVTENGEPVGYTKII